MLGSIRSPGLLVLLCALLALVHGTTDTNTTSTPQGPASGLAWDKHDFDVANNKGGDVKVEVNLAAPMTAEAPPEEEEDISDLLRVLAPEDPVNPLDLMSMMRDLMATMKPEEPASVNITQVIEEFKETLPPPAPQQQLDLSSLFEGIAAAIKESRAPQVNYPPAPPASPETIINALQPPPPPPAQPFDVGAFMREMRETMAANKPPPVPPAGLDPQLLDLIRQTMNDLKDMKKEIQQQQASPAPPAPVPSASSAPSPDPSPVGLPPVFIPPAPPAAGGAIPTHDTVKDMIKDALSQIKPPVIPPMPSVQDDEIARLRDLIHQQMQQSSKPIILPPPVVPMDSTSQSNSLTPPPPPPPSELSDFHSQLRDMVAGMLPRPQRIPAPPTINIKKEVSSSSCCPAPAPNDSRAEVERCPLVNGVARPRCKRDLPPSVVPVKCTRAPCSNTDADGDVDVDQGNWAGSLPDAKMPAADFNPKKLLLALCPGGLCPAQKDLDPKLRH